ncbi:recombinase family protein [Streptococcus hillyeri]|uniref:recombinase family protein n=1 Tax=Streptococcus hillyeri TaxID=2282420 RepID=UPI003CCC7975
MKNYFFVSFLKGYSAENIAKELNTKGIKGWSGKANWYPSRILKKSTKAMLYCRRPLQLIF